MKTYTTKVQKSISALGTTNAIMQINKNDLNICALSQIHHKGKIYNEIVDNLLANASQVKATKKKSRIPFTQLEDEEIQKLVKKYGTKWNLISSYIKGRTAKQIRDRYFNYLVPGYFKGEWTKQEDEMIKQLFYLMGPKWSVIQSFFPHRCPHSIKNRWYFFLCRQQTTERKQEASNAFQSNYNLNSYDESHVINHSNELNESHDEDYISNLNQDEEIENNDFLLFDETTEKQDDFLDFDLDFYAE